jgi:hypothetical protein
MRNKLNLAVKVTEMSTIHNKKVNDEDQDVEWMETSEEREFFNENQSPFSHSNPATGEMSVEEQKRLAKLESSASSNPLPEQYYIDPDRPVSVERPVSDNPGLKAGFVVTAVGGFMGVLTLIWFGFLAPRTATRQTTANPQESPSPRIVEDEAAELRGRLAFQDQQQALQEETPTPRSTPTPTPTPTAKATPTAVSPPETIDPPLPQRVSSPPPSPVQQPEASPPPEAVDPFERWSQLAALGQQRATLETPVEAASSTTEQPTLTTPIEQLTQTTVEQPTLTPVADDAQPSTRTQPDIDNQPIAPTVPTATSRPSLIPQLTPPAYIASTQLSSVLIGSTATISEDGLSPGARGILTRTPVSQSMTGVLAPKEVALGTTAQARVVMPMIWDTSGRNTEGMQRFAIELTEDMKATDDSIALPKGTIFVAETSDVSEGNNLVSASAIAVIYPNDAGEVRQATIPFGSILVRGEDGEALVAESLSDPGSDIAKQDLLVGLLSSLGRIGEIFNQPDIQTRTSSSEDDFDQTTISRSREPQIWAAALEGFFRTTADRLSERSDRAIEELLNRPNVVVLPEGTEVSIVVNSFFRVAR